MNIQKTKVFGTYNIVDVVVPVAKRTSSKKYKSVESNVTHIYNDLLSKSGITYEKSKSESINERSIHYTGKDRVNFTYGEITLSSMIDIFDVIYRHRSDNILHQTPENYINHGVNINDNDNSETTALDDNHYKANQQQTSSQRESNNTNKGIFYDLGSGVGVPVFMAALLHPLFEQCVGIEILNNLHSLALQLKQIWDNDLKSLSASLHHSRNYSTVTDNIGISLPKVEFYQGSFLDLNLRNWSTDGDIYFINSTCFDDMLLNALEAIFIQYAKSGCYIITLSQKLKNDVEFEVVDESRLDMSWGSADVFIHMRR